MYARNLLLATSLGLGGCWPRIPGAWADYDVPDETQLYGGLTYSRYVGGYWDDPDPVGSVLFGYLDTPIIGLESYNIPDGCTIVELPLDDSEPVELLDLGVSRVSLRSSAGGSLEVPFVADGEFFTLGLGEDDVTPGEVWTLDPVSSDEGEFFVNPFIELPPDLAFGGLELDGDSPATVPSGSDIIITWTPQDGVDHVLIEALLDDQSASVQCSVPGDAGVATVPATAWASLNSGDGLYLFLNSVRITNTAIDGVYGASRMSGVVAQVAYVGLE